MNKRIRGLSAIALAVVVAITMLIGGYQLLAHPTVAESVEDKYQYITFAPATWEDLSLRDCFNPLGIKIGFIYYGTVTNTNVLSKHANIVVSENAAKMRYVQPYEDDFRWDDLDEMAEYADGLPLGEAHASAISWYYPGTNPVEDTDWSSDWLWDYKDNYPALDDELVHHIQHMGGHLSSTIDLVSPANEGYWGQINRTSQAENIWAPLGNAYVYTSTDIANNYWPVSKVEYNTFDLRSGGSYDWDLVHTNLLSQIGVFGIQLYITGTTSIGTECMDFTDWNSSYGWATNLADAHTLIHLAGDHGLKVQFSEIGVCTGNTTEGKAQQAEIYAEIAEMAIEHRDIVNAMIFWGGGYEPAYGVSTWPIPWDEDEIVHPFDKSGNPQPAVEAMCHVALQAQKFP